MYIDLKTVRVSYAPAPTVAEFSRNDTGSPFWGEPVHLFCELLISWIQTGIFSEADYTGNHENGSVVCSMADQLPGTLPIGNLPHSRRRVIDQRRLKIDWIR